MPVPVLSQPPGKSDESYVLPFLGGELWTIPTSNSVMRMVVTGEESKGEFAVVTTDGQGDQPIGFHYHREAHDVFLCLKGSMNVWADDQARTLYPGDFASVPPGAIHQYQILGPQTSFTGLIVPGGWEEFFRFIGEPYTASASAPLFPTRDNRNPMEVLVPKLIAATEKFDMVPARGHKGAEPIPCNTETDAFLPETPEPYFLKADAGARYASGGLLVKPLARPRATNGRFAIARLEATSCIPSSAFSAQKLRFRVAHHAFVVDSGAFQFCIGGEVSEVRTGETVFVPAGVEFGFRASTAYAALYCFSNGGGLVEVLCAAGREYGSQVIAEDFPAGFTVELEGLEKEFGFEVGARANGVHD